MFLDSIFDAVQDFSDFHTQLWESKKEIFKMVTHWLKYMCKNNTFEPPKFVNFVSSRDEKVAFIPHKAFQEISATF